MGAGRNAAVTVVEGGAGFWESLFRVRAEGDVSSRRRGGYVGLGNRPPDFELGQTGAFSFRMFKHGSQFLRLDLREADRKRPPTDRFFRAGLLVGNGFP